MMSMTMKNSKEFPRASDTITHNEIYRLVVDHLLVNFKKDIVWEFLARYTLPKMIMKNNYPYDNCTFQKLMDEAKQELLRLTTQNCKNE